MRGDLVDLTINTIYLENNLKYTVGYTEEEFWSDILG